MSLLNSFLTKFFGNKSDRDIREINPFIELIKAEYDSITQLSNDQLREKATQIRKEVLDYIKPENDKIEELKIKAENDETDVDEKEKIYQEIDRLEKEIDKKIEEKKVIKRIGDVILNNLLVDLVHELTVFQSSVIM